MQSNLKFWFQQKPCGGFALLHIWSQRFVFFASQGKWDYRQEYGGDWDETITIINVHPDSYGGNYS